MLGTGDELPPLPDDVLPRHAVHAGGGFALERVEYQPERGNVNLVEKRGEPCLLRLPSQAACERLLCDGRSRSATRRGRPL